MNYICIAMYIKYCGETANLNTYIYWPAIEFFI